jgi:chromosome segregation ATPase
LAEVQAEQQRLTSVRVNLEAELRGLRETFAAERRLLVSRIDTIKSTAGPSGGDGGLKEVQTQLEQMKKERETVEKEVTSTTERVRVLRTRVAELETVLVQHKTPTTTAPTPSEGVLGDGGTRMAVGDADVVVLRALQHSLSDLVNSRPVDDHDAVMELAQAFRDEGKFVLFVVCFILISCIHH